MVVTWSALASILSGVLMAVYFVGSYLVKQYDKKIHTLETINAKTVTENQLLKKDVEFLKDKDLGYDRRLNTLNSKQDENFQHLMAKLNEIQTQVTELAYGKVDKTE